MLTLEGCRQRQLNLWDSIPSEVDWLVIADPAHIQYLVNFQINPISFSGGERGLLILERNGSASVVADNFAFRSQTFEPYLDERHQVEWYDHRQSVADRDRILIDEARKLVAALAGIGMVESNWLPEAVRSAIPDSSVSVTQDLSHILRSLRRCKLPDEVALIERTAEAAAAGHARALEVIEPGLTELDMYREVQQAAVAHLGCAAIVYGDFRANCAQRPKAGGLPTTHTLAAGELFLLDYSVVLGGYRCDFTNTLAVDAPTAGQSELFSCVEAALQTGAASLRSGVAAADVFEAVNSQLQEAGHGPLRHHAGHGIGLAHPEPPILVPDSTDTLKTGDVVTIEPGLYVEGIGGIRLEHNYLIEASGCRQLSHHRLALTTDL